MREKVKEFTKPETDTSQASAAKQASAVKDRDTSARLSKVLEDAGVQATEKVVSEVTALLGDLC